MKNIVMVVITATVLTAVSAYAHESQSTWRQIVKTYPELARIETTCESDQQSLVIDELGCVQAYYSCLNDINFQCIGQPPQCRAQANAICAERYQACLGGL